MHHNPVAGADHPVAGGGPAGGGAGAWGEAGNHPPPQGARWPPRALMARPARLMRDSLLPRVWPRKTKINKKHISSKLFNFIKFKSPAATAVQRQSSPLSTS